MSDGAVALYDIFGDPMAVEVDTAIPAGTATLIAGGSDGTNARFIKVDSSGNQIIVGLGTAGSPSGGIITIQGDPSGSAVPISGTVTANAGSGNFSVVQAVAANLNATIVGTVTANIGTSGSLALDSTLAKLTIPPSTAIGSNTLAMVGGHVTTVSPTYTDGNINPLSLTTAGALRIDGSNVTQPVSGTVTSNQGTPNSLANRWPTIITDGTNTMPTGDAIARSIYHQISDATTGPVAVKPASTAPAQGDKALVVVISPNQQAIPVASTPATANGGLRAGYAKLGGGTAGVLIPVLSTTYNEQSSNAQRSMSSSSTNDTSAGTGARTVEITYYTSTFTGPFTETITMNGTSAVNTVATNICYIESLIVKTAGSTGVNVGTITLYASTGGAGGVVASIGANTLTGATGDTRTLYAQHYVPTWKICFITGLLVSASGGTSFFIKTKDLSTANAAEQIASGVIPTSNPFQRSYGTPIAVVGPAKILAYAIPSSNNTTISASLDFFEQ